LAGGRVAADIFIALWSRRVGIYDLPVWFELTFGSGVETQWNHKVGVGVPNWIDRLRCDPAGGRERAPARARRRHP
jgi:hypothetical protein